MHENRPRRCSRLVVVRAHPAWHRESELWVKYQGNNDWHICVVRVSSLTKRSRYELLLLARFGCAPCHAALATVLVRACVCLVSRAHHRYNAMRRWLRSARGRVATWSQSNGRRGGFAGNGLTALFCAQSKAVQGEACLCISGELRLHLVPRGPIVGQCRLSGSDCDRVRAEPGSWLLLHGFLADGFHVSSMKALGGVGSAEAWRWKHLRERCEPREGRTTAFWSTSFWLCEPRPGPHLSHGSAPSVARKGPQARPKDSLRRSRGPGRRGKAPCACGERGAAKGSARRKAVHCAGS